VNTIKGEEAKVTEFMHARTHTHIYTYAQAARCVCVFTVNMLTCRSRVLTVSETTDHILKSSVFMCPA